ncbi:MAG: hypothetical protein ACQGVC_05970 [Myxococcota bacterium]
MAPEEVLVALGEVAAAFAGFTGVVGALGARSLSDLPSFVRFRFANLLIVSVAATLFAFLPVLLAQVDALGRAAWSGSSVSLGVFAVLFFYVRLREGLRLDRRSIRPRLALVWMLLLLAVAASQLVGVVAVPAEGAGALYASGVFGLLVLSALQFVSLALPEGG